MKAKETVQIEIVLVSGKTRNFVCEEWDVDEDGGVTIQKPGEKTAFINSDQWVSVEEL